MSSWSITTEGKKNILHCETNVIIFLLLFQFFFDIFSYPIAGKWVKPKLYSLHYYAQGIVGKSTVWQQCKLYILFKHIEFLRWMPIWNNDMKILLSLMNSYFVNVILGRNSPFSSQRICDTLTDKNDEHLEVH